MTDVVNIGTTSDDGNGDTLRSAFSQINTRFNQILGTLTGGSAWAAGVTYTATPVRNWVVNSGSAYVAATNHVSGATFAADFSAGKWLAVDTAQLIADLAAASGSSMVGYLPAGIGAVGRTVQSKLRETISICDFGGYDDWTGATGTNSFTAMSLIYAAYPSGVTIKLPKLGTGVYYFNGSQYTASGAGFVFVPDDGVSFVNGGVYIPCLAAGVKFTKQVKMRDVVVNSDFYFGSEAYAGVVEKKSFMGEEMGESPVLFSVDQTTCNTYGIAWPNGPVVSVAPSSNVTDTTTWNPAAGAEIRLVTQPIRPGSEINAYFGDNAAGGFAYAGSLCAGVVTDAGFVSVRQDVTGGSFIVSVKSGTNAIVEIGKTPASSGQANYRFYYGMVGIRIHTSKSFSVMVNGIEVAKCPDAGGVILEAGFGPAFATNSNYIVVAGMSVIKSKRVMGTQPLKIVVCGDSITDQAVPCSWADYMRQYLSGVGGAQIITLNNIALSGATSTGQSGALLSTNISGYDYALIQVGVNDIQGGATVATFISNITSMVNYCILNDVVPIVGVPSMFYSQIESSGTGSTGQATLNVNSGSPYRSTLLRYLAANNVAVNIGTLSDTGAVLPILLTASNVDPVVADNIHPTAYGRMVYGFSWAKALIGKMIPKVDKSLSTHPISIGWCASTYGDTALPSFSVDNNTIGFSGYISSSGDPASGATLLTLPLILRPLTSVVFSVVTATSSGTPSSTAFINVGTNGVVSLYGAVAGTRYIYMGFNFQIQS